MIQIDMPMPEACDVCPFNYDFCWCNAFANNDEWEKYSDDWNENVCDRKTRPEYCPLKEQEAKTVIKIAKRFVDCDLTGYCPSCSRPLIKDWAENYCGFCGKPILWEGR